ncbi:ATPase domain-containing protein [Rhizobium phage RHph_TM3_14A]|nr:ATPase domain-containing protein [Rhizobium phage RHph_TM27A]QIG66971.1 ATPase domain-containing protein [Rhizobium phage RHph_TM27B]QIG67060.1 ATPase domain-containing protein [Rhizobium phage RHph_TM29]QIG67516.1 ATPase domain-containing protein [Rhizobium phage RHph_TM3_14A]
MNLDTVIARMPYWYAARKSVYLKSAPGRGKTETISRAPEIISAKTGQNIGFVLVSGPLLTPADSIGYLVPRKVTGTDHEGKPVDHMESVYTDPFWFRTKEGKRLDEYDGGIILVDEADKMDVDVKKVIGEAALSGRLGPHKLPDGWVVWMAGNRMNDRSGSTKELDHLINRRLEIDVTDDIESWHRWAAKQGVPPVYRAFANENVAVVFNSKVPEKQGPWCTPRSMSEASFYHDKLPKHADGTLPDDEYAMEEISGFMGDAATAQLFSFVKLEREMPKFEEIVANPRGAKVPQKVDACMLVAYNLAHRVKMDDVDPVIEYVGRMPSEFGVVFGKNAVGRDAKLITSAGFTKWIAKNASLMAQIGGHAR